MSNQKEELIKEIDALRRSNDAVILAHYYVSGDIQAIADYVGDSFYLARIAKENPHKVIVFCGVSFMGESASILNPDKKILMPDEDAHCPMALMAGTEEIKAVRERYDDLAVVCYINSMAETKAQSDVCVTSSNALGIVGKLRQKNIYFIPDQNLARYVSQQLPGKNIIPGSGFCYVHHYIKPENVKKMQEEHPKAQILVHPESNTDIVALADYVGSTSGIINYSCNSDSDEFIICTERGIEYELLRRSPNKKFYFPEEQSCDDMKKITLEKVRDCLQKGEPEAVVSDELRKKALLPLERMFELGE